jgi:hypothetical protein
MSHFTVRIRAVDPAIGCTSAVEDGRRRAIRRRSRTRSAPVDLRRYNCGVAEGDLNQHPVSLLICVGRFWQSAPVAGGRRNVPDRRLAVPPGGGEGDE